MFKIVYVHACNKDNKFNHMLHISLASLRRHMPNIEVNIVVDTETARFLRDNDDSILRDANTKIVEVECPEKYSKKEQSRFLKTNLRELVQGDFLFIDSDTVICEDFSQYEFSCSVGMVRDVHLPVKDRLLKSHFTVESAQKIGLELHDSDTYYNSGVIFAKDDAKARKLFHEWHDTWKRTELPDICYDQFSLCYVNHSLNAITELDGIWNTQVNCLPASLCYLYHAKIIHYFSLTPIPIYLLQDSDIMQRDISDPLIQRILDDPRTAFKEREYAILASKLPKTDTYKLIAALYEHHPRIFQGVENLLCSAKKLRRGKK